MYLYILQTSSGLTKIGFSRVEEISNKKCRKKRNTFGIESAVNGHEGLRSVVQVNADDVWLEEPKWRLIIPDSPWWIKPTDNQKHLMKCSGSMFKITLQSQKVQSTGLCELSVQSWWWIGLYRIWRSKTISVIANCWQNQQSTTDGDLKASPLRHSQSDGVWSCNNLISLKNGDENIRQWHKPSRQRCGLYADVTDENAIPFEFGTPTTRLDYCGAELTMNAFIPFLLW